MEHQESEKFRDFKIELEALCKKHGVQLATSTYDSIQVWDLDEGESSMFSAIEDKTSGAS